MMKIPLKWFNYQIDKSLEFLGLCDIEISPWKIENAVHSLEMSGLAREIIWKFEKFVKYAAERNDIIQ